MNATALSVVPYAGERDAWDEFVRRTPGATFFHLIGWKEVLERSFGFDPHYFMARRGDRLVGVLPLFELRAPGMPRGLLSLPFAVEAGVCTADSEAQRALDTAALELGAARGARFLELRDGRRTPEFTVREGQYYAFRHVLAETDTAHWSALSAKRRNMIRRAQSHRLVSRIGQAQGNLRAFYDLYAVTMRRLGTPVFPARFFRALLETFPAHTVLLTVWCGDVAAAGTLIMFFGEWACVYYSGSRREYFRCAVNDFLYWEAMRHARSRGARVFDFGRSKVGTGAYDFKRYWGFTPQPLRYRVHSWNGNVMPRSSQDAGLHALQAVWQRLPLAVTKLIGPWIVARWGAYYT